MKFNINVKEWNDKKLYSAPIHNSATDADKITYWLDVQFAKCDAPTENCYINVDYGFMSCYKAKDETIKPKLIVMQWTKLASKPIEKTESNETAKSEAPKAKTEYTKKANATVENILKASAKEEPEEDLPF